MRNIKLSKDIFCNQRFTYSVRLHWPVCVWGGGGGGGIASCPFFAAGPYDEAVLVYFRRFLTALHILPVCARVHFSVVNGRLECGMVFITTST